MNTTVFARAIRTSLRSACILGVVAGAFFWLVMLSSSSFLADTEGLELPPFLREPPRVMQAFVGGTADFISPVGWLSTSMFHPIILALTTMGGFLVVVRSGAAELEQGSLDLVLARPVGRARYLGARAAAALVLLGIVEAGGAVGTLIARGTVEGAGSLTTSGIALTFAGHYLLFAALTMFALWVFARSSLRGRALGISISLVVGGFFLNFVSLLFDQTRFLGVVSPFHYYSAADVLLGRDLTRDWLVLAATAALALGLALRTFATRDLTR